MKILIIGNGLIANMLRLENHAVTEASGPWEALAIIKEQTHEIDLVLTDVATEPITGLVFANHLDRQRKGIPVFFLADPSIARAIGGCLRDNGMIEKPFTAIELSKALGKFWTRFKSRTEAQISHGALTRNTLRARIPAPIRVFFGPGIRGDSR